MDGLRIWPYVVLGYGSPKGQMSAACTTLTGAFEMKQQFQEAGCWAVDICLRLETWNKNKNEGKPWSIFGEVVEE